MFILLILWALCAPALSIIFSTIYYLKRRVPWRAAILIGLAYGAIFYNYLPDSGNDSWRHMALLENYRGIPIWQCLDAGHYSQLYVWDLWNWVIAQLHLPFLLQASGACLGFTMVAYLVFDYCKTSSASARTVVSALALTLMSTNPMGFAIGIRSSCAYMICILAIYQSEIHHLHKAKALLLMASGILIHHSAALIAFVWLFLPLVKKKPIVTTVCIACMILGITSVLNAISAIFPEGNIISGILQDASYSISVYQQESDYNVMMSTSLKSYVELGCSLLYIAGLIFRGNQLFAEKAQVCQMKNAASLYLVVALLMMSVLTLNGSRYFMIPEMLAVIPLIASFQERPFGVVNRRDVLQIGTEVCVLGGSMLHLMLNLYSMSWGDASFGSLFGGALSGVLYALIAPLS